jgi:hypothetical protein
MPRIPITSKPTKRPPEWTPPADSDLRRFAKTARDMAVLLRMSPGTAGRYLKDSGIAKTKRGYSVSRFVEYVREREAAILTLGAPARGEAADDSVPAGNALEEFRRTRTAREKLALGKDRADLLTRESVREAFEAVFGALKANLNSLPNRLAPLLAGQDDKRCRELLDGALRDAMAQVRVAIEGVKFRGPE